MLTFTMPDTFNPGKKADVYFRYRLVTRSYVGESFHWDKGILANKAVVEAQVSSVCLRITPEHDAFQLLGAQLFERSFAATTSGMEYLQPTNMFDLPAIIDAVFFYKNTYDV